MIFFRHPPGALLFTIAAFATGCQNPDIPRVVPVKPEPVKTLHYRVSTLAGSGAQGFADGVGTAAEFMSPHTSAFDAQGNLYVTDGPSHRVRKISPAGVVTTLAGGGPGFVAGGAFADGVGSAARFRYPHGVVVDGQGALYVADSFNHRIRKITPAGEVSTFAGTGVSGYANGPARSAQFFAPNNLAFDRQGNLYVSEPGSYRIRKITPAGEVSTFAGTGVQGYAEGSAATAQFYYPEGLCFDPQGNLYVADGSEAMPRIRKISPAGVVSTFAGSGRKGFADLSGTQASFGRLAGLTADAAGNLYAADEDNSAIRQVTPDGTVRTLAGTGAYGYADGPGATARFDTPLGVTVDAQGNVYVADTYNSRVRKITVTLE